MATNLALLLSQFADLQCQSHWMSGSQHSLSLSVDSLFVGAIPWPRTSLTLLPNSETTSTHSFDFNNEITNEIINKITNEITIAHCSVPMPTRPSDEAGSSP